MKELTQGHIDFLKAVCQFPCSKHPADNDYNEEGDAYWKLLEELELIECAGSWKWKPTFDVYKLGVEAKLKEVGI